MNRVAWISMITVALLAGCGGQSHQDLRNWMGEQGKGVRGKLDPLPQIKPYEPFAYADFDLPDPFKPRKIEPVKGTEATSKLAPDLNRRKEPLEAYPLENLRMVGTLQQNKQTYALVKSPDNNLFRVKSGNYLGQNFGLITTISESTIKLKEIVQDSGGDWTERVSTLTLAEEAGK